MPQSRIIEFFGVPGCGKTTVAQCLIEALKDEGIEIEEYSSIYRAITRDKWWRMKMILEGMDKEFLRYALYYFKLYLSLNKKNTFNAKYCFFSVLSFLVYKKIMREKKGLIICDQGLVQYVFSVFYDQMITNKKTVNEILSFIQKSFPENMFIYCAADEKVIIERLKDRDRKESRVDGEPSETIHNVVHVQNTNAHLLSTMIDKNKEINISMETDSTVNANRIVTALGL